MRKTIIILVILITIASAEDVLTINPQVKIGETFDELFGTTMGFYPIKKAAGGDADYIHRMNWGDGLWDSTANAPDTTYMRLARETGIKVIRLYIDYWDIPHYYFN